MWTITEHRVESKASLDSPIPPPKLDSRDSPSCQTLEIAEIDSPSSPQHFEGLFDGQGLRLAAYSEPKWRATTKFDMNYGIERITKIKEIDPGWQHDEKDEIAVTSPKHPSALPRAVVGGETLEAKSGIPTAVLSDFALEISDLTLKTDRSTTSQLCVRRETGKKYTIERRHAAVGCTRLEQAILEVLTELDAPFVSSVRWAFREKEDMYMVFDHLLGGSLLALVNQYGALGSHHAVFYTSELVAAISSLHSAGIVHRNLDPQNVVLDSGGHVVITGFGCADFVSSSESEGGIDRFDGAMSAYQAPEILVRWPHNSAADCWSFGMLLYFMHSGTNPDFKSDPAEDSTITLCNKILRTPISTESLDLISPMARDLTLKCLERNPAIRWNVDKIKTHPYFCLVDWHQVSSKKVEVPPFVPPTPTVKKSLQSRTRRMSCNPALFNGVGLLPRPNETSHELVSGNDTTRLAIWSPDDPPSWPELLEPVLRRLSLAPVPEEERVLDSVDVHDAGLGAVSEANDEDITAGMSRFRDNLDAEDRASIVSATSGEIGKHNQDSSAKVPKLRKSLSAINAHHHLVSLRTASFLTRIRKKLCSTGALNPTTPLAMTENLSPGDNHIGGGLGFTYNVPEVVPSRLSVPSFTPSACHNLFTGGWSARLGLSHFSRKAKAKGASISPNPIPHSTPSHSTRPHSDTAIEREGATETFVDNMYHTAGGLLSPPDSVLSLALVNSTSNSGAPSPVSVFVEPLSPATLMDDSESVNIFIPKSLVPDWEFLEGMPDSTLRLVPPSKVRMSSDTGDYLPFT